MFEVGQLVTYSKSLESDDCPVGLVVGIRTVHSQDIIYKVQWVRNSTFGCILTFYPGSSLRKLSDHV